ncbi:MAG: TIGR03618 family F420-dependent PPOX class oxidoreductase, partial [Acidimicrobiia bacterium]
HRGVLVTRRGDGRLQTSPIVGAADGEGRYLISSRQTAYKVRNLRRDPTATICLFADEFFGGWVQVDGRATIVDLPEALGLLVATYRRIAGEHPDWGDFENAMIEERRVIIAVEAESVGPVAAG